MKEKSLLPLISIVIFFVFLYSCTGCKGANPSQNNKKTAVEYDADLKVPDSDGGGYFLTPLGCLIYGPWQVSDDRTGYNIKVYLGDKEISSVGEKLTEIEKELVFELQRDGSLKYWFKKDYERHSTAEDSAYEKDGVTRTTHYRSDMDKINKIYAEGNWKVNFKDSTLIIQFDDNSLPQLNGRYSDLGSDDMQFQKIYFFDSLYNGEKVRLKKVLTTYYEHPWINNL